MLDEAPKINVEPITISDLTTLINLYRRYFVCRVQTGGEISAKDVTLYCLLCCGRIYSSSKLFSLLEENRACRAIPVHPGAEMRLSALEQASRIFIKSSKPSNRPIIFLLHGPRSTMHERSQKKKVGGEEASTSAKQQAIPNAMSLERLDITP